MARDTSATAPAANKSPTVSFLDYLPNNYIEKTNDVHEGVPHYDDAIGRNFHELSAAGRVATMLQYATILVAVIAIVTSRALIGAEVAFTLNKPTYEDYMSLEENEDVLNLQCDTSNSTLIYNEFAKVEYEQSGVCDWVVADLQKNKLDTVNDATRTQMRSMSVCKQSSTSLYMCQMVKENCEKGKNQIDALVERVLSASLALPTLASRAFLEQTLKIQTNLTIQASLDSARDAQETVNNWASDNMPVLYGYLQNHMNAIQALRYHGTDTELQTVVGNECPSACTAANIGDGACDSNCNVPECLYDGGDCMTHTSILDSGPNVNVDFNWNTFQFEEKFVGFPAIALGNPEDVNPAYAANTCVNSSRSDDLSYDSDATNDRPYCGDFPLLSIPTNAFNLFDADMCANSSSWSERLTVDRTAGQIQSQRDWGEYSYYEGLFTVDNVQIPDNKPDGNPPYATTLSFSCDRHLNRLSVGGYAEFTADRMMEWANHYRAMSRKVADECDGTQEDFSDCTTLTYYDSSTYEAGLLSLTYASEQEFFLEIERGAIINMAIENSGSLAELALDASLKKNASGFAIFPTTDHEKYFNYAGVTSCKYTKKLKPEPGALTTVILGVIGGIVNLSTYVGVGFYVFSKKRILKRDAAMHGSAA